MDVVGDHIRSAFQYVFLRFTGDEAEVTAYTLVEYIVIAGVIFIVFVLCLWVWHAWKIWLINSHLKSYKSRKEFAENFDLVKGLFEEKRCAKSFCHQWKEFKETLIVEGEKEIRNTKRPFDYFHYGDLEWSPRQFSSWPNVFVGVGLLLTFVGLAAAIGEAASGVASSDVSEAQDSLQRVLNAASVKFLTSIAGLAVSIVLGLVIRATGWVLRVQIRTMCEHIERCTLYSFSEPIEKRQLVELERQTRALETFTDNFAVNLGEELENRLNNVLKASFAEALSPLNDAVRDHLAKAENRGSEAVESLMRDLGEKISAGTGEHMEAIVRSLGEVRSSLGTTIENLSQSLEGGANRMSGEMDQVTKDIREAVMSMTQAMNQNGEQMLEKVGEAGEVLHKRIDEGSSKVSENMAQAGETLRRELTDAASSLGEELGEVTRGMAESLDRFERGVRTLDEKLRIHSDMLDRKIRGVQETLPHVESAANSLREASEPIALTADKFGRASEALQSASSGFDEVQSHLRDSANTMKESLEKTSVSWEEYRARFEGVDENLKDIFEQYEDHIQTSQDQMRNFVKELDQHFAKAGESLKTGTGELGEALEGLTDEIEEERKAVQGLKSILEELTREVKRGRDSV
jgi:methyl-accepting chemotaxis protein